METFKILITFHVSRYIRRDKIPGKNVVKFRYFGWRAGNTSKKKNNPPCKFLRPFFKKKNFKNLYSKRKKFTVARWYEPDIQHAS